VHFWLLCKNKTLDLVGEICLLSPLLAVEKPIYAKRQKGYCVRKLTLSSFSSFSRPLTKARDGFRSYIHLFGMLDIKFSGS